MPYEVPANMTGIVDFAVYANDVTQGWFGNAILFFIFSVFFIATLKGDDVKRSFVVSSTITTIFCVIFFMMGAVGVWTLGLCILALIVSWGFAIINNEFLS